MADLFKLQEHGSDVRREVVGGITTFVTMAYIIVVNPAILQAAGIPIGPSTVATILAAVFGTMLMAFYANRPIALAPYMGENAFLAYVAVAGMSITVGQRLGAVFVGGAVFLLITVLHIRGWLANSISSSLKHSFAVGIGLFLSFIGLYNTGIVKSFAVGKPLFVLVNKAPDAAPLPPLDKVPVSGVPVPVELGHLGDPLVLLAISGFVLTVVLMVFQVRGAILLGIVGTALVGYATGHGQAPKGILAMPFTGEYSLAPVAFQLDILGVLKLSFLPILLTLFLMDFLDTLGTLIGVGAAGNLLDEKGDFPKIERPMLVDALASMFGALVGTSTTGAYIESATGIRDGARTGLAALVTGLLFLASLFFIPLVAPLQQLTYAYGPALIVVGILLMQSVTKINFSDLTEAVPAFATIVMMLFTYNIGNGLTVGLVLHPIIKLAAGRWSEVTAGSIVLGLLSLVYYVFGMPH